MELIRISPHWYFTLEHNRETLRNASRCFLPAWHSNYTRCIDKPLVVSGWWYTAEAITGATTGGELFRLGVAAHQGFSADNHRGYMAIISRKPRTEPLPEDHESSS